MSGYGTEQPVILQDHGRSADDLSSTGDDLVLNIVKDCQLYEIGGIVTTTMDGAATVKVDIRPTADSDSGRGDGDAGSLTFDDNTAAGKVIKNNLLENDSEVHLSAGDQLVFQVTSSATTAGGAKYYAIVRYLHEDNSNESDTVEVSS